MDVQQYRFNGTSWVEVNPVPATHDHDERYLQLTGGTLTGDLHLSSILDGHAKPRTASIVNNTNNNKYWGKVASTSFGSLTYRNRNVSFVVSFNYSPNTRLMGILNINSRVNVLGYMVNVVSWSNFTAGNYMTKDDFVVVGTGSIAELWVRTYAQYCGVSLTIISETDRNGIDSTGTWTLYNVQNYGDLYATIPTSGTQTVSTLLSVNNAANDSSGTSIVDGYQRKSRSGVTETLGSVEYPYSTGYLTKLDGITDTTRVSNLNSDMLDNMHLTDLYLHRSLKIVDHGVTSGEGHWGKIADITMPVANIDKIITFIVIGAYSSDYIGELTIRVRNDNSSTQLRASVSYAKWHTLKETTTFDNNNIVLILDGLYASIWAKTSSMNHEGISFSVLSEIDTDGKSVIGSWNLYSITNPTLTDLSTISGTKKVSTVDSLTGIQPTLVSGSNIHTINGLSIVGAGNISISGNYAESLYGTYSNGASISFDSLFASGINNIKIVIHYTGYFKGSHKSSTCIVNKDSLFSKPAVVFVESNATEHANADEQYQITPYEATFTSNGDLANYLSNNKTIVDARSSSINSGADIVYTGYSSAALPTTTYYAIGTLGTTASQKVYGRFDILGLDSTAYLERYDDSINIILPNDYSIEVYTTNI